jgi:transcriptional regulator with XRE-family HTH domain
LAELTGRSYNNISRIRQGKDNPNLRDFCNLLNAAESLAPGFYALFLRKLTSDSPLAKAVQPYEDVEVQISRLSVQSRKKLVMDILESLAQERQPEPVAS